MVTDGRRLEVANKFGVTILNWMIKDRDLCTTEGMCMEKNPWMERKASLIGWEGGSYQVHPTIFHAFPCQFLKF